MAGISQGHDSLNRERQHSTISLNTFIEFLGYLSLKEEPYDDYLWTTIGNLNPCLANCFHQVLKDPESDKNICLFCSVIQGLMHHFANCTVRKTVCLVCFQLYKLHRSHVIICQERLEKTKHSTSDICFALLESMEAENFDVDADMFYSRLKKFMSEMLCVTESLTFPDIPLDQGHRRSDSANVLPNVPTQSILGDIPSDLIQDRDLNATPPVENMVPKMTSNSNKSSDLDTCEPNVESIPFSGQGLDLFTRSKIGQGARPKEPLKPKLTSKLSGESNKLCGVPESQEIANFNNSVTNQNIELSNESLLAHMPLNRTVRTNEYLQDPYDTQKTYGESRVTSLPVDCNFGRGGQQFSSLETRPVGEPGIGEVVYGTLEQLRLVAHHWSKLKNTVKDSNSLPQQQREEGVILSKHKKKLRILRTLYQKHYQWERLSHLGNGAAGKCHLAMDLTTEFKFCVKRLFIHKYEEQELNIWCDLHHENIVQLFGALRHGEKVYILAEFIDGGNLSSCINEQKAMNRRLSHVMALTYLRQLLHVLVYLKSKGILHEDIKSDNILLRKGSTSIAVCDFGLSRYINQEKDFKGQSPAGTPTQWSPEKAASDGYGFPSEVWAAMCVLVHIMSGDPPWIKRYQSAAMLHFIIFEKSPPLEDVPRTVQADMLNLIQKGFMREESQRPTASQLLAHPVFNEIVREPEKFFSILGNENISPSRSINDDLQDIVKELEQTEGQDHENAEVKLLESSQNSQTSSRQLRSTSDNLDSSSVKFSPPKEVTEIVPNVRNVLRQPKELESNDIPNLSIFDEDPLSRPLKSCEIELVFTGQDSNLDENLNNEMSGYFNLGGFTDSSGRQLQKSASDIHIVPSTEPVGIHVSHSEPQKLDRKSVKLDSDLTNSKLIPAFLIDNGTTDSRHKNETEEVEQSAKNRSASILSDTNTCESENFFDFFLNDNVDTNKLNFHKPNLTMYKNYFPQMEQSATNCPVPQLSMLGVWKPDDAGGDNKTNVNMLNQEAETLSGTTPPNQKSTLHIDISSTVKYCVNQQNSLPNTEGSEKVNYLRPVKTAEGLSASQSPWSQRSSHSSSKSPQSARDQQLDAERDQLVENLKQSSPSFIHQENDYFEDDVNESQPEAEIETLKNKLQQNGRELNGLLKMQYK